MCASIIIAKGSLVAFLGAYLSGLSITCLSAWMVFKWQWCDWTNIHSAGNLYTTGK